MTVQDQGPEMARKYHQRVFDTFLQVAKGKSAETISVGLGLTFYRRAVQAHGGVSGSRANLEMALDSPSVCLCTPLSHSELPSTASPQQESVSGKGRYDKAGPCR